MAYDYLFIGDSIAAIMNIATMGLLGTALNRGVGGSTIISVYDRLSDDLIAAEPSHVFLQCGSNEIRTASSGISIDDELHYYDLIYLAVKNAGADLQISELTPTTYCSSFLIGWWNWRYLRWAKSKGDVKFARTFYHLVDVVTEKTMDATFTTDGVHPNTVDGRVVYNTAQANGVIAAYAEYVTSNSLILCIGNGNKTVTISGGVGVQYRLSDKWFLTTDAVIGFTDYAIPFTADKMFLHVKVTSESAIVTYTEPDSSIVKLYVGDDTDKICTGNVDSTTLCKDTYIESVRPLRSFGWQDSCNITTVDTIVALIRYELKSLFDSSLYRVKVATLYFKIYSENTIEKNIYVRRLNKLWGVTPVYEGLNSATAVEGQPTFERALRYGDERDVLWGSPSGFSVVNDTGPIISSTYIPTLPAHSLIELDVTSGVTLDIVDDNQNFGYAIYQDISDLTGFISRSYTNGLRPYLYLELQEISPYWGLTYPKTGAVTSKTIEILAKTDQEGTAYYVVLLDGSTAPSSAEVRAGTGASGAIPISSGFVLLIADSETSVIASGLMPGTAYNIYVVAESATSDLQASPELIIVSTVAISVISVNSPELFIGMPSKSNFTVGSTQHLDTNRRNPYGDKVDNSAGENKVDGTEGGKPVRTTRGGGGSSLGMYSKPSWLHHS